MRVVHLVVKGKYLIMVSCSGPFCAPGLPISVVPSIGMGDKLAFFLSCCTWVAPPFVGLTRGMVLLIYAVVGDVSSYGRSWVISYQIIRLKTPSEEPQKPPWWKFRKNYEKIDFFSKKYFRVISRLIFLSRKSQIWDVRLRKIDLDVSRNIFFQKKSFFS